MDYVLMEIIQKLHRKMKFMKKKLRAYGKMKVKYQIALEALNKIQNYEQETYESDADLRWEYQMIAYSALLNIKLFSK